MTDLQWLTNEPEELARLAHYTINQAGITALTGVSGMRNVPVPGIPEPGARGMRRNQDQVFHLFVPKGTVLPNHCARFTLTYRGYHIGNKYPSFAIYVRYITLVCEAQQPMF